MATCRGVFRIWSNISYLFHKSSIADIRLDIWRCFLKDGKVVVQQETEEVFLQKQPSEGFFKKDIMRSFTEFTRKHLCQNLFFVFSCEFCETCKTTLFAEQHRTTASEYSSINSSEG